MIDRQVSYDSSIQSVNISIKVFPKKALKLHEGLDVFSIQCTQSMLKEHTFVPQVGTQAGF